MSNITPINNVLMQPIQYNGKVYFTSHYFHQQYRANSVDQVKYEALYNFNKLIRSIQAYPLYVERGDIVELTKGKTDSNLESVFKATYGKPVMLINATAQVALTHHLDDEISKQVSVSVNAGAAKQLPAGTSMPVIAKDARSKLQLAKMFGLQGSKALVAVNSWVGRDHGVNIMEELGVKSLKSDAQSSEITGTEIGERAGIPGNGTGKAQNVNLALWYLGYLKTVKAGKGNAWEITDKGKVSGHVEYDDMEKETGKRSSMQVIIYHESLVDVLKKAGAEAFDFKDLKQKRKDVAA